MVQRLCVIATLLIAPLLGCGSHDSVDDDVGSSCSGSHGKTLTCESPNARPIWASKYDAARGCFEAFASPSGWCAVPTYCPGGGGTTTCAVTPSGDAYLTYLLYGEETTKPDWHFDDALLEGTPVTGAEQRLCSKLWAALEGVVDADGGVADDRTLYAPATATAAHAAPACD
jgi:hypothetical protein